MKIKQFFLFCLSFFLSQAVFSNPYETTLENGLRVIVKEDHRAPTVVHMLWYRLGSMDEMDGQSGVAHVLEHMMFKGTPTVGAGEFNRQVALAGGRDNAFTSQDYTAYFQQIPKEKLADMMRLESDRMRHLLVDPEAFSKEIKVVIEERRLRTDDSPESKLFEQMNATAFQTHPYRRPVIGWMDDLQQMTAVDAKAWFQTHYVPNNAHLVVVGDVDHQAVFDLAKTYYGAVPRREIAPHREISEPIQEGTRRIQVKATADLPVLIMAWKVPVLRDVEKDEAVYALDMLAATLSGHSAARLPKKLVQEDKVALSAAFSYDGRSRGPGMVYFVGTPAKGKTILALEKAVRAEILKIQSNGISEQELQRARRQYQASKIYAKDSLFGQAMEIGMTEAVGLPYQSLDRQLEKLLMVKGAAVQEAAKKYLVDEGLTVGILEPVKPESL